MKKIILVFALMFSVSMVAQNKTVYDGEPKTFITKTELPIGKSFALLLLDGSPMVTGIITRSTLADLPKNDVFILSVEGLKVQKYRLPPLPSDKPKKK